jgi:hypothetical protein
MAGPSYYDGVMNIAMNEDWSVPFQYGALASDGVTVNPIDLTGSTLKLEIRLLETDHEAIVSVYSPDNGISWINPTTGYFVVTLTRDRLRYLYAGNFFVDLVRLMPNGLQERLWEGTATVVVGTTR